MNLHDDIVINALLCRIASGVEVAFRQVFDHFKKPFYAAAFKMTRSALISEEIVQEVFILLWNKRLQVAGADKPRAYLLTMLHNCIYMELRKLAAERKKLNKLAEVHQDEDNEASAEDQLVQKEKHALLESIINSLPDQQRMVYRMAKQEGLSRNEIAAKLNLSSNTVRNHLAAAVRFIGNSANRKNLSQLIWVAIFENL